MKLTIYILSLIFSFGLSLSLQAQTYNGSYSINVQDSSDLTASYLLSNNQMITASLSKKVVPQAGTGFPDMRSVGNIAIRKLDSDGNQLWETTIPNSSARITHIEVNSANEIIVSGGFHDTIQFDSAHVYYAHTFRLNAFIASYSSTGEFNWVHVTDADVSYSKYYYTFDIYNNQIYAPFIEHSSTNLHLHVLDMQGDSVNDIQLAEGGLLVSEFEFDDQGNVYFCGTGSSATRISGNVIGSDSTFSYMSFIAKLNSSFQHEWSYSYEYITFDFYPQMAFNDTYVAFLVDTIPQHNGIGNYHQLTYYSHNGKHLRRDSVGGGVFNNMHKNIALEAFGDKFVYVGIVGWDTLSVISVDPQFNYTQLATIKRQSHGNVPFFTSNDSVLILNHIFMDSLAIINDTDFIVNTKHTYPFYTYSQQFMVKFTSNTLPTSLVYKSESELDYQIYPNPSASGTFNMQFNEAIEEEIHFELHSVDGKLLRRYLIEKGSTTFSNNFSELKQGIYIITLRNVKDFATSKWIRN